MTEIKKGLSSEQVSLSRQKYGENKLEKKQKSSFIKSLISNLSDPIIRVLIIALFINVIFMFPNINWFETGGIGASILIATFVSTISEYSSDNAFERLKEQSESTLVRVRRDGEITEIDSSELVVSDVVIIGAGERVCADMTLLSGEVSVDESALTGESIEIRKKAKNAHTPERESAILKGSLVISGRAECIVTAVGATTYYGKVASELGEKTRPSPLKHRLSKLAKSISILGYIASFLIAIAYLFNVFFIDSGMVWSEALIKMKDIKFVLSSLLNALTLAVSIIVVAVPEGLPMMITVVLSSNMKKMMNDGVIVRKLVGIETSGSLNILFTDKTGTLTEGRLKVKAVYTADGTEHFNLSNMNEKYKKYLTLCAGLCNGASYNGKKALGSDATDRAIRELVKADVPSATVIDSEPFDSTKKYMSTVVNLNGEKITLFKGAPEKLISASDSYLNSEGEIKALRSNHTLNAKMKELASGSYRVVALGMKIGINDTSLDKIVFIGIVAIRDKIRKQVPSAIKEVSEAGVGVVMITGDNKDTAEAIARECGIISPYTKRNLVLTGNNLASMTDDEIKELLPRLAVIARALPSDKSRLVRVAQSAGLVVGMTGDGINDASSLKSADVGFAMGSGTDVAKEASDIVISDNNFASIVKAILYGRTIFESIRKFIVFQLTMNFGAVGISLIGPFIGIENPVTVTQMLWVNIIMDTLGALAFASEPAERAFMKMPPKSRDEKIISAPMLGQIVLSGMYILCLCVWFLKSYTVAMLLTRADEKYMLSAFFAMFIFMGIFVCFNSRTSRINLFSHLSKNKSFVFIMLLISAVQMNFIYFGGEIFRAVPLKIQDLVCVIAISFSVSIFDLVRKTSVRLLNKTKVDRRKINVNK